MSKSIKLKNNTYWDSSSITHNKIKLQDILNYDFKEVQVGYWFGNPLYRICRSIHIQSTGNQAVLSLPSGAIVKICNAWLYKENSKYSNLVNWNSDEKEADFGVLYYNRETSTLMINTQDIGYLQLVIYYAYK